MIVIWMKKHLVIDGNYNFVNLLPPPKKKLQGMINNVGLRFSVGDTILWFKISIDQDN
jgi:hypothetical protein